MKFHHGVLLSFVTACLVLGIMGGLLIVAALIKVLWILFFVTNFGATR